MRFLCSSSQPLGPLASGALLAGLSAGGGEVVLGIASAVVTLAILRLPGLDMPLTGPSASSPVSDDTDRIHDRY